MKWPEGAEIAANVIGDADSFAWQKRSGTQGVTRLWCRIRKRWLDRQDDAGGLESVEVGMLSLEAAAWIEQALLTLRGALTGATSVLLQPRDRDNAGFVVDIDSDKFVAQFILWAIGEGMFECGVYSTESAGPVLLLAGEGRADLDRAFAAFVECISAVEVLDTA